MLVPLLLLTSSFALMPPSISRDPPMTPGMSRRALLGSTTAAILAGRCSPASARDNLAEEKLAAILAEKVKEREAALGFVLDADDIREIENILRNKYCGPQGGFSGEPGGTCAEVSYDSISSKPGCKSSGGVEFCTK